MKKIALVVLLVLVPAALAQNIIISEVYYDPNATESGGEFVELYNPSSNDIDISGWQIATESSDTDAVLPENSFIYSNSYYIIADASWDEKKDNPEWPSADHEEPITMSNSDAGVALINNGTVIDAVGWGDSAGISKAFLYEGTPSQDASNALSLQRISSDDTDNNSADFIISQPNPQNTGNNSDITIELTVTGASFEISSITVEDDDNLTQGFQVIPYPARKRRINITANITNNAGYDLITNVTATIKNSTILLSGTQTSNTTGLFIGTVELNYFDTPGNYNITVNAVNTSSSTELEYLALAALQIDSDKLSFSAVSGSTSYIFGDSDLMTSSKPTLRNIGNTQIDVQLSGTDLVSNNSIIESTNINYNISGITGTLNSSAAVNMQANSMLPLGFMITIPETTLPGTYTGTAVITAVSSG